MNPEPSLYSETRQVFAAMSNDALVDEWVRLCKERAELQEKLAAAEDTMWDRKIPLRAPKRK